MAGRGFAWAKRLDWNCDSNPPRRESTGSGPGTQRTARIPKYEHFIAEPAAGAVDPLSDIFVQEDVTARVGPPTVDTVALGDQTVTVSVYLNEWLSIRRPGRFRITAETKRVVTEGQQEAPAPIRSNAMEITITTPEAGWAESQLKQAVAVLERPDARRPQIGQRDDLTAKLAQAVDAEGAARTLRFPDTPEAPRALARFFEHGPQTA